MYSSENMKNKFSFKSVLILLGILLVAAVTALLLFSDLFLSPKKRVENGVLRTLALSTDSFINNGASGKGLLANKALLDSYKFITSGKYESNNSYVLKDIHIGDADLSMLHGLGLHTYSSLDLASREYAEDISVKYNIIKLISTRIYINDNILSFECPDLFDGYVTADTTTLGKDLSSSELADILYLDTINEYTNIYDISFNLFDFITSGEEGETEGYSNLRALYDTLVFEKGENKGEYIITVPGDALNTYFNTLEDNTYESQDDIIITVMLNSKGYFVGYDTSFEIYDGEDIYLFQSNANLTGEGSPLDNISMSAAVTVNNDYEMNILVSGTGSDESFRYDIAFNDNFDKEMELSVSGTPTFDKETILIDLDEIRLRYSGLTDIDITISAEFEITTTDEDIDKPSGKEIDILNLNRQELEEYTGEIISNIKDSPVFGMIYN